MSFIKKNPNRCFRSWNSLDPHFKSIQTTSKFKQTLRANLLKVSNYYLLGSIVIV